ncbi:hypothetical protein HAX54_005615 [Datura stramonium]|uniref:Protein kinase domain-containing protein n=1 Tax=Datura stramonium TaxID=4076 RepID=A0ABS8TBH4_DATST|nr:hypothetical protein [Datura stramonium]
MTIILLVQFRKLTTLPNLQVHDMSNNNLSGPIPLFPPSVKFTHTGNLLLGKNITTGGGGGSGSEGSGSNSSSPGESSSGAWLAKSFIHRDLKPSNILLGDDMRAKKKALDETMPDERSHLVTWFRRVISAKTTFERLLTRHWILMMKHMRAYPRLLSWLAIALLGNLFSDTEMGHAVNVLGPLSRQWKPWHMKMKALWH